MGAFSIWHLLVILVIVILLFGTKRLRNIGSDLGNAIKSFRNAVKDEEEKSQDTTTHVGTLPPKNGTEQKSDAGRVIEGESTRENNKT